MVFSLTEKVRSVRNDFIIFSSEVWVPNVWSLYNKPACQTRSKAFSTSKHGRCIALHCIERDGYAVYYSRLMPLLVDGNLEEMVRLIGLPKRVGRVSIYV